MRNISPPSIAHGANIVHLSRKPHGYLWLNLSSACFPLEFSTHLYFLNLRVFLWIKRYKGQRLAIFLRRAMRFDQTFRMTSSPVDLKKTAFLTISKDLSNHVAKSDLVGTDPGSNLGVHTGFSRFIFWASVKAVSSATPSFVSSLKHPSGVPSLVRLVCQTSPFS